ncbi:hypothetical protein SDC9_204714 [bioreactor metagenome]|uniref:Uncharacterized protein n=1 Tax=bioreactor metagenome TaxID=1076179 RepID=A0A645J1H6_9ZZZZ
MNLRVPDQEQGNFNGNPAGLAGSAPAFRHNLRHRTRFDGSVRVVECGGNHLGELTHRQ